MSNEINKIQCIIRKLGYENIFLENERFEEILFYNSLNSQSMIFGAIVDKSDTKKVIDIGNISIPIGTDKKPHLGCFTIIREITEDNIKNAVKIVEEETELGNANKMFINYHDNVDDVISDYVTINNYAVD